MIPYGRQDISQEDIDAVVDVLQSDFLTQGPKVPEFEKSIKAQSTAEFAVAVNSATSALHIACLALDLSPGDWLWTSPITFVASANCARYCGASVDFVDIDPLTNNMCPRALEEKLQRAERAGTLPKVVVPVHLCGYSCDMRAIAALGERYGFRIIEDASHSIGATYCGEPVGNCRYSDITVFSFHPVKIVTTAEGGAATCNDPELARRMQLFRSHGITRDSEQLVNASPGPWYYEQLLLGMNYRMTDIHAALGVSQMQRLDEFIKRRHAVADFYDDAFSQLPLQLPPRSAEVYSSFHLYVVRLKSREAGVSHAQAFNGLRERGIGVNLHYIPVHTQPYYHNLSVEYDPLPEAMAYYSEAISLPMFHHITPAQQGQVIAAVADVIASKA